MAAARWEVVVDEVREVSLARVEVRVRGRVRGWVVKEEEEVLLLVDDGAGWLDVEVESVVSEMRDGGYVADSGVVASLPAATGTVLVVANWTGSVG